MTGSAWMPWLRPMVGVYLCSSARRRIAVSMHSGLSCTQAPRPGSRAAASATTRPSRRFTGPQAPTAHWEAALHGPVQVPTSHRPERHSESPPQVCPAGLFPSCDRPVSSGWNPRGTQLLVPMPKSQQNWPTAQSLSEQHASTQIPGLARATPRDSGAAQTLLLHSSSRLQSSPGPLRISQSPLTGEQKKSPASAAHSSGVQSTLTQLPLDGSQT